METAFFSCVGRIYRRGRKFNNSIIKGTFGLFFVSYRCMYMFDYRRRMSRRRDSR